MNKVAPARIFDLKHHQPLLCLSFTSDNRFLLSSHTHGDLLVWSIVDG